MNVWVNVYEDYMGLLPERFEDLTLELEALTLKKDNITSKEMVRMTELNEILFEHYNRIGAI